MEQQARKNPIVKHHKEPNTQASLNQDFLTCLLVTDTLSHSHLFGYKSGREMHTSSLDSTLYAEPHVRLKCVPGWGLNFNLHFKTHVVVIEKNWGRNIAVTTSYLKCWLFETVLNAVELD